VSERPDVPASGSTAAERVAALVDLVEVRVPVADAVRRLRHWPWDSDEPLLLLDRAAAVSVLQRYRCGELTAADLETWADAIEGRDDIGFAPGQSEQLTRFVFETANPSLAVAMSDHHAGSWIARLTGPT
jgi:hypothetical protein